jgi:hypothetical protein
VIAFHFICPRGSLRSTHISILVFIILSTNTLDCSCISRIFFLFARDDVSVYVLGAELYTVGVACTLYIYPVCTTRYIDNMMYMYFSMYIEFSRLLV